MEDLMNLNWIFENKMQKNAKFEYFPHNSCLKPL